MRDKNLWCLIYKSIPLVFENSLSYMEIQAKILDYINKLKNDISLFKLKAIAHYFCNLTIDRECPFDGASAWLCFREVRDE